MFESIYPKLPIFLQNLACTAYGWKERQMRFNRDFRKYLAEYLTSQHADKNAIQTFNQTTLRQLLTHCQAHVPYYRDLFAKHNVDVTAEDSVAELAKIPVLSKETLRNNVVQLAADNYSDKDRVEMHTSGTTGKSLTFYRDKLSISKQWAMCFRHRDWHDCKFGDLHINFTGKTVVPTNQKKPPFWRFNGAFNQYLVNMQHINEGNIKTIVDFLNSLQPKYYLGYPSIISEVARLALAQGLELLPQAKPQIVFAGAENTLDYQKDAITSWTGAKVSDLYGLTEGNCHLSRCEYGHYHVDYEYGFVECVDPEPLEGGRKRGRIVGTSFTNWAMPLVRYDTGDMAIWMPDDYECPCGRKTPVIERIEGRIDDFVVLNDGRRVMRFDYLFKGTDDIKEIQVCQYKKGQVVFKLVSRIGQSDALEQELEAQFVKWMGEGMDLVFEYVDHIPRSKTGKFKAVQSYL